MAGPGNSGGESETIIGEWVAPRGNRDDPDTPQEEYLAAFDALQPHYNLLERWRRWTRSLRSGRGPR